MIGKKIEPSESLAALGNAPALPPAPAEPQPSSSFRSRAPRATLAHVVLSRAAREGVQTLLNRVRHHDALYTGWKLAEVDPTGAHLTINLFGPSGTGKTLCAEAIAAELGRPLLDVSYGEIESKYVGETGKNIIAAFESARTEGATLFFDEADSILGRRMSNVTQAADHAVNVARAIMLKQLDLHTGVVLFATNLARNFDPAFVRRITHHVEIGLPDEPARQEILRRFVPEAVPGREKLDFPALAGASSGLSGGDLRNVVLLALSTAIAREGAERRVKQEDMERAVAQVIRAKQEVGAE